MPVLCKVVNLIVLFQNITRFVIPECKKLKILEKLIDLEYLTHQEQKTQKEPLRPVLRK